MRLANFECGCTKNHFCNFHATHPEEYGHMMWNALELAQRATPGGATEDELTAIYLLLPPDLADKLILYHRACADREAEIHQSYQSSKAWEEHEAALVNNIGDHVLAAEAAMVEKAALAAQEMLTARYHIDREGVAAMPANYEHPVAAIRRLATPGAQYALELHDMKHQEVVEHWVALSIKAGLEHISNAEIKSAIAEALRKATQPGQRLQAIIERDRTQMAESVTAIKKALENYSWLIEGRGSYEWDDDRWHDEFKTACQNIREAMEPLVRMAGDLSDSPTKQSEVEAARKKYWLLYFDDKDRQVEIFDNEAAARARFADANLAWACYLFEQV